MYRSNSLLFKYILEEVPLEQLGSLKLLMFDPLLHFHLHRHIDLLYFSLFAHEPQNNMNKIEKSLIPNMPYKLTLQHMPYSKPFVSSYSSN